MKHLLTVAAAVAALALSLSPLGAQNFESVRVHFDQTVQVGNSSLPAGDYAITVVRSNGDVPLLRFSSGTTNVIVLATREERAPGSIAQKTEVQLDKSGDLEKISRIEIEGGSTDFVLPVLQH